MDFEYFRFEQYRGALPLQKNEVQFELRVGRQGRPQARRVLSAFHRRRGERPRIRRAVWNPRRGREPLFVVVRSALAQPVGTVSGIRLEKARQPIDWTGLGVPPRRTGGEQGDWVFPDPTNRPRSAPAERFRPSAAARPFFRATRLASRPVIDGALTEWQGRALELNQSLAGTAVDESPAQAWIGVDDSALYVALRCPLRDAKPLAVEGHRWGDTDGVELAFQDAEQSPPGPILTLRGWPDGHFCAPDVAGVPDSARSRLEEAVTYRAATGSAAWTCEWRIPLAACGLAPEAVATVSCNLTVRNAAQDSWRTWNMTGGATYDLRNGGTVILGASQTLLSGGLKDALEVWLDAADAATIERGSDDRVRVWKDKSGKGRHATQAVADFFPWYEAQGLNGKAALRFDDARKTRLELPDLSDRPMAATIFAVISNPEPGLPNNHNQRIFTASNGKEFDYLCGLCCAIPGTQTGGPRSIVFEGQGALGQGRARRLLLAQLPDVLPRATSPKSSSSAEP